MARSRDHDDGTILTALPADGGRRRWRRLALLAGIPLGVLLVLFLVFWSMFFHYVPPGQMLVVVAKDGDPLPEGEVLAEEGQKGIRREVLGEGWHFVWPVIYATERHPNFTVKKAKPEDALPKIGIVTAKGGKAPK